MDSAIPSCATISRSLPGASPRSRDEGRAPSRAAGIPDRGLPTPRPGGQPDCRRGEAWSNGGVKAAQRDRYGSPDVVEIREVATPVPTEDRVLVKVEAASVNRADLDQLYPRWQFYRLVAGLRRPRSPNIGLDVAGTVEAVGPSVTHLRVGDRVYADLFSFGMGSFAEHV